EACWIYHRGEEPAHFGVHEVFAAGPEIRVLPGSLETAPRLPCRTACQREDVVHKIPTFRGGGGVSERRHGTERGQGRKAAPDLDRIPAARERPGRCQVAGDHGIPSGILLPLPAPSVGSVAASASDGGVEIPP